MNIPSYPLFEPLEKAHKPIFDTAFKNNPPGISEFTFTNLYSWRRAYSFEVSILRNFIILKSSAGNKQRFFNPIGTGGAKEAIIKILEESGGIFIRAPESAKALFNNDARFIVEMDRDNSDYLFRADDLVLLAGKKYDGKRNLIKKFRREYEYKYIELNASNVSMCFDFEEKWCSIKDCDSVEGLNNERMAIKDMISNFSEFNLTGGAIEVNNEISGLAIAERLNSDTIVMHILKAGPGMQGLYQVTMNEFLKRNSKGFEYVNLEQDLGMESLRRSKESYHSVKMIDKYTISLKK